MDLDCREKFMSFGNIANPEQLALLRQALAEHCTELGIDPRDKATRETIAVCLLLLFYHGATTLDALRRTPQVDWRT